MNFKSSVFIKTFSLIFIMALVTGTLFSSDLSAAKKGKGKKPWYPMQLHKLDLTADQKAKLDKLSSYKKLLEIKAMYEKKELQWNDDETKKIKKENGWNDELKEFKKDSAKILTDKQKKELKETQANRKKKK